MAPRLRGLTRREVLTYSAKAVFAYPALTFAARAWQRYGFVDALNPLSGWYDPDVIGIDVGITMLMAENQRTDFVWTTFMENAEAQAAFNAVGLK